MLDHLRGLREDRDLSQKDVADFLNIHQTTYSDYELVSIEPFERNIFAVDLG